MILTLEKIVLRAFVGGRIMLRSSCMSEMLLCCRTLHTSVQMIWVNFRSVWLRKQKIFVHVCTNLSMHSLLFITVEYRHFAVSVEEQLLVSNLTELTT